MFTGGKLIFAIAFLIVFTIITIYMYRKDLNLHKIYYKGSIWILVAFLAFIGILFIIKFALKD